MKRDSAPTPHRVDDSAATPRLPREVGRWLRRFRGQNTLGRSKIVGFDNARRYPWPQKTLVALKSRYKVCCKNSSTWQSCCHSDRRQHGHEYAHVYALGMPSAFAWRTTPAASRSAATKVFANALADIRRHTCPRIMQAHRRAGKRRAGRAGRWRATRRTGGHASMRASKHRFNPLPP